MQPLVRRLEARFSSTVAGGYAETLERAATVQNDIVKVLVLTLTVVIFGTLVPPLLLLAPVAGWLQLCAMDLVERNKSDMFWGQVLASNVLVQVPLSKVSLLARVGMWGGACFVFVDLEFELGPVLVYALFAALEVTVSAYRWRKIRTTGRTVAEVARWDPCGAIAVGANPLVSSPPSMPLKEDVCPDNRDAPLELGESVSVRDAPLKSDRTMRKKQIAQMRVNLPRRPKVPFVLGAR